jgi:hypothetical protein
MRKFLVVATAIAAASCGGTSSNLSTQEARSVASEISAVLQSEAVTAARNQLSFGRSFGPVTKACSGGGSLTVQGSLSVNCPSGLRSCATTASLSVAAAGCTTDQGVIIDGTLTATVTGTGFTFTKTIVDHLTITAPGGEPMACDVHVYLAFGQLGGVVCGVPISR